MDLKKMREQLVSMGVDPLLLDFIEKMDREKQLGLYELFLTVLEDELLFVLALNDLKLSNEYLTYKEQFLPAVTN